MAKLTLIICVIAGVVREGIKSGRGRGGRHRDLEARIDQLEAEIQQLRGVEDRVEVLEDIATTGDIDLQHRLHDLQEEKGVLRRLRD